MLDCSTFDTSLFKYEIKDYTAILRLKDDAFRTNMDVCFLRYFLDHLNEIELNDDVKGLLIVDSPDYHGVDDIKALIDNLQKEKITYLKEKGFTRYGNSAKRLTLTLNEFSKPIVVALEGQIPIDAFGYFMACDTIIASDDLSIEFPSYEVGLAPIGAVTFFLQREIGSRNTLNLYLSGESLDAEMAQSYMLIDHIVEKDQLIDAALEKLQQYYTFTESAIVMTKQLTKARTSEIDEFFTRNVRSMWDASM